jgi:glycosyltransferase involved in cell wall biosynthesis
MATCNGEAFVAEQISSILQQLTTEDELIISDDSSIDNTVNIIRSFDDPRITLYNVNFNSFVKNFEFVLSKSTGNYIFLSDQDDIWLENKVSIMLDHLQHYDLVASNALVTNKYGDVLFPFYKYASSDMNSKHVMWKIFRAPTSGCCMAFKRSLLKKIHPFPRNMYMHDRWIWALACIYASTIIIDDPLILYRRHENNATNINGKDPVLLGKSQVSIMEKIRIRYILAKALFSNLFLKKRVIAAFILAHHTIHLI